MALATGFPGRPQAFAEQPDVALRSAICSREQPSHQGSSKHHRQATRVAREFFSRFLIAIPERLDRMPSPKTGENRLPGEEILKDQTRAQHNQKRPALLTKH
jgi:hypothetical protein